MMIMMFFSNVDIDGRRRVVVDVNINISWYGIRRLLCMPADISYYKLPVLVELDQVGLTVVIIYFFFYTFS